MADFLTGRLTTLEHGTDTAWASRDNYLTVYVADVWKVKPRLTLNYGLRWEPYFSLDQSLGVPYHFDYALFQQGVKSKIYPNAPAGFRYPGDAGFPNTGGPMEDIWLVFNPRVGFAWDVEGNGRTSIRASAGRATDFTISQLFGGGASAPPWGFRVNATSPSGGFDNPWSDYPGGSPVPYTPGSGRFDPFAIFAGFMNYKMKQPVVESWNLSIQRELASNWVASASYIGSTSLHMGSPGSEQCRVLPRGSGQWRVHRAGIHVQDHRDDVFDHCQHGFSTTSLPGTAAGWPVHRSAERS
jgi:hypothetical protein